MSYLGRKDSYSECGFLGFNLKHPEFYNYINRVINIYITGEIFSLKEWHDSWIWDHVRIEFEEKNILFKNISGKGYAHHHPFINSGLENFFDHLKGPVRKRKVILQAKTILNNLNAFFLYRSLCQSNYYTIFF